MTVVGHDRSRVRDMEDPEVVPKLFLHFTTKATEGLLQSFDLSITNGSGQISWITTLPVSMFLPPFKSIN